MFRMRRYRVFVIFAIIAVGALYHFTSIAELESAGAASVEGLKSFGGKKELSSPPTTSDSRVKDTSNVKDTIAPIAIPSLVDSGISKSSSVAEESEKPVAKATSLAQPTSFTKPPLKDAAPKAEEKPPPVAKPTLALGSTAANKTTNTTGPADPIINPKGANGRLEILAATGVPKIHWSQLPEHFPVPTENLIQLPTGKPKAIPKVQHTFSTESAEEQTARLEKRDLIKKAFIFSWAGYREKAWLQDELSPVSGKFRNPFCSWGATLVDTMDTLWMMDMQDEFELAVEAVKSIDFTTSPRNDIPLFETVIRYLGGLVAAYDISDSKYRILLDKAVELAEILMGAFDTPNRMPMTFYLWKPTFASQPHRAKTRVVLAELGSLSVEFTRLAQITKEAKYYDAIARITNEFDIWQNNTRMPGIWPVSVDASGCKKPDMTSHTTPYNGIAGATDSKPLNMIEADPVANPNLLEGGPAKKVLAAEAQIEQESGAIDTPKAPAQKLPASDDSTSPNDEVNKVAANVQTGVAPASPSNGAIVKREIDDETGLDLHPEATSKPPECEPQGLASPPFANQEEFTIGGQADSTFEYLPKEYLLLGGLEDKYRTMYETFADANTKNLLFRPMIPEEKRHILHAGKAKVTDKNKPFKLTAEGTHLTCFAGGMYALGAKVFGREDDMDIAKKLTDGCVWAYQSTRTGIMPESYLTVRCPDETNCPWNETLWHEALDPHLELREKQRLQLQKTALKNDEKAAGDEAAEKAAEEKAAIVEPPKGASKDESIKAASRDEEIAVNSSQSSRTKAEEAVAKPAADKALDPAQEKAEKAVSKPTDGTVEKEALVEPDLIEETAQKSSSKPIEGAPPPNSLTKRQLGDINEAPLAASAVSPDEKAVAAPVTSVPSTDSVVQKTTAEQHLDDAQAVGNAQAMAATSSTTRSNSTNSPAKAKAPVQPAPPVYHEPPLPTHEEFVAAKIRDERIPEGMTRIDGRRYLLRPEAIESVFIMWRTTGDVYWREKGWEMFKAVEKYTRAPYGASAIQDVTSEDPTAVDEMESFWLAETLKYFYLLFSEPSLVSLDDYVLNTEAHPFKRLK